MSAFGLTEREQEVTRLVLKGESTAQIAAALVVTPQTVQEHLRDNEARVPADLPVRGGPLAPE